MAYSPDGDYLAGGRIIISHTELLINNVLQELLIMQRTKYTYGTLPTKGSSPLRWTAGVSLLRTYTYVIHQPIPLFFFELTQMYAVAPSQTVNSVDNESRQRSHLALSNAREMGRVRRWL